MLNAVLEVECPELEPLKFKMEPTTCATTPTPASASMLVPQLRSLQQRRTVWMWMPKRSLTMCACPHGYRERLAVQPAMKGDILIAQSAKLNPLKPVKALKPVGERTTASDTASNHHVPTVWQYSI